MVLPFVLSSSVLKWFHFTYCSLPTPFYRVLVWSFSFTKALYFEAWEENSWALAPPKLPWPQRWNNIKWWALKLYSMSRNKIFRMWGSFHLSSSSFRCHISIQLPYTHLISVTALKEVRLCIAFHSSKKKVFRVLCLSKYLTELASSTLANISPVFEDICFLDLDQLKKESVFHVSLMRALMYFD